MRPIDADKLNKFLLDEYHGMISDESMKIYEILRLIDKQPTVEAEPIVYCKYCRYWYDSTGKKKEGICRHPLMSSSSDLYTLYDNFCKYGKLK